MSPIVLPELQLALDSFVSVRGPWTKSRMPSKAIQYGV